MKNILLLIMVQLLSMHYVMAQYDKAEQYANDREQARKTYLEKREQARAGFLETRGLRNSTKKVIVEKDTTTRYATTIANEEILEFSRPIQSKEYEISSPFGIRNHPVFRYKTQHAGIDLRVPSGTEVKASATGKVVEIGRDMQRGRYIIISHAEGYTTHYFHLQSITVNVGDYVKRNNVIGYSGNSGLSTGSHLHFEIRNNSIAQNPAYFINF